MDPDAVARSTRPSRHNRTGTLDPVPGAAAEIPSLAMLAICLGVAVVRPWRLSEAVFAMPAAAVLVSTGVVPIDAMNDRLRELGPTVTFLAPVIADVRPPCADAARYTPARVRVR